MVSISSFVNVTSGTDSFRVVRNPPVIVRTAPPQQARPPPPPPVPYGGQQVGNGYTSFPTANYSAAQCESRFLSFFDSGF